MKRFIGFLLLLSCAAKPVHPPQHPPLPSTTSKQLLNLVHSKKGEVVLVNIWATWCPPCVEEMPTLMELNQKWKTQGFDLILVSADLQEREIDARRFLEKIPGEYDSFIKGEKDSTFIPGLDPRWSGSLPASFLYDRTGKMIDFWEGEMPKADLIKRVSKPFNR